MKTFEVIFERLEVEVHHIKALSKEHALEIAESDILDGNSYREPVSINYESSEIKSCEEAKP